MFQAMEAFMVTAFFVMITSMAMAEGTIPDVVAKSVDLGSVFTLMAGGVATWLFNQGLKSKVPALKKFLPLLSPVVGSAILGIYQGTAGGITGSGHIGRDIGQGAMLGAVSGIMAVWGHNVKPQPK